MGGRAITVSPLRQTRDLRPIAAHHGFLFLAAPAFDLLFGGECFFAAGAVLTEYQINRQSCRGVAAAQALLVFGYALFEIVGVPGVIGIVGATQDVNPETHDVAPRSYSPFDIAFSPE